MGEHDRVLWEEGMFLGPQHFQQQDRHASHQMHARLSALAPHGYGLCSLRVDETALEGGTLVLKGVAGVFPDGTAVDAPFADPLPRECPLAERFGQGNGLRVSLAIASARPGLMLATAREGSIPGRYRRLHSVVPDDFHAEAGRDVALGELNLRLVLEGESTDGLQLLPLCRIRRLARGGFGIDPDYVPPVLWLSAAPQLREIVRNLVTRLGPISERLTKARATRQGGTGTMTAGEMANYWMCYCLNSALPLLRHHIGGRGDDPRDAGARLQPQGVERVPETDATPAPSASRSHPETVYRDLAALAGALCTFTLDARPEGDPAYDHNALGTIFAQLAKLILDRAKMSAPDTCVEIPLAQHGVGEWTGQIPDETLFDSADFYVAAFASTSQDKIIRDFPNESKLGSPEGVAHVRRYAKKGVRLTHLPAPPPEIPRHPGWHYFAIDTAHPMWQSAQDQGASGGPAGAAGEATVRKTRNVEVYAPLEVYPDLKLEIYAVRKAAR